MSDTVVQPFSMTRAALLFLTREKELTLPVIWRTSVSDAFILYYCHTLMRTTLEVQ